ncbi:unnamed protein product [Calicophoron daubneyi]|uniref:MRH domain-containing protein n=1 Tax=Calicophoron daubneyi TaxID=300641 RepID=A0AAV2T3S9_CALDB
MLLLVVFILFLPHVYCLGEELSDCTEGDLHFDYSSCDSTGGRWVFLVPSDERVCKLTNSSIPKRVYSCEKTCPSGMYLNLRTQTCEICRKGTYSRGDTLDFFNWPSIPKEMSVDVAFTDKVPDNCSKSSWRPNGQYVLGEVTTGCSVMLSMKLHNLKDGEVFFTYSVEDYGTMAFFSVRSDRCSQIPGSSFLLQRTGRNVYRDLTVRVPKGNNVLQWYLFSEDSILQYLFGQQISSIKIARIRITGTPPIVHCTSCPAGTYSDVDGASNCTTCPANSYSALGSSFCTQCNKDEYSEPGSAHCSPRKPCTSMDYMSEWTKCDSSGMTQRKWTWIEPMICNSETGVSLPSDEEPVPCKFCPLGTRNLAESTLCAVCPTEITGNGSEYQTCVRCASDKVPVFGLMYDKWSRMPPGLRSWCSDTFSTSCRTWQLEQNSIGVGVGLSPTAVASLELSLPAGFIHADDEGDTDIFSSVVLEPSIPNTLLQFEFEMLCEYGCSLLLKKSRPRGAARTLGEWLGNARLQNYTYLIKDSRPVNFTWIFHKQPAEGVDVHSNRDHVRIYRIRVTNAAGFGAIGCQTCASGIENGKCIPCPRGLFYEYRMDEITHQGVVNCTACPPDTIVSVDATTTALSTAEACLPCEPGTKAVRNSFCMVDTLPVTKSGVMYNLTKLLQGNHTVRGINLFTPSGNLYYHEYRLTLAYGENVVCTDQTNPTQQYSVQSVICRQTAVRISTHPEKIMYTTPMSLGDRLLRAVPSNYSAEFWEAVNKNLTRAGWPVDILGRDVHYLFETYGATSDCPNGRMSVVTLRCGPNQDDMWDMNVNDTRLSPLGTIDLPPACPDGTCDGCFYQFLWTSPNACPICRDQDFSRFYGECRYGKRSIHLAPPFNCRIPDGKVMVEIETCPILTTGQIVAISLTFLVVAILVGIICLCYRKNKRLQYKYMKLIQSTGNKMQPTSCALEEREEDTVDSFGRRVITAGDGELFHITHTEPPPSEKTNSKARRISPVPKLQLPKLGPIVFKSKSDSDCQTLPDNEFTGRA